MWSEDVSGVYHQPLSKPEDKIGTKSKKETIMGKKKKALKKNKKAAAKKLPVISLPGTVYSTFDEEDVKGGSLADGVGFIEVSAEMDAAQGDYVAIYDFRGLFKAEKSETRLNDAFDVEVKLGVQGDTNSANVSGDAQDDGYLKDDDWY